MKGVFVGKNSLNFSSHVFVKPVRRSLCCCTTLCHQPLQGCKRASRMFPPFLLKFNSPRQLCEKNKLLELIFRQCECVQKQGTTCNVCICSFAHFESFGWLPSTERAELFRLSKLHVYVRSAGSIDRRSAPQVEYHKVPVAHIPWCDHAGFPCEIPMPAQICQGFSCPFGRVSANPLRIWTPFVPPRVAKMYPRQQTFFKCSRAGFDNRVCAF